MRAVILAQGNQLQVEDLALDPNAESSSAVSEPGVRTVSPVFSQRDPFESTLELLLDAYEAGSLPLTPPCGHWLEDALVAAAFEISNQSDVRQRHAWAYHQRPSAGNSKA